MSPGVGTPGSTTTNSNQETVVRETDVVAVAQDLENFGITKSAATRLMQSHPAAYIREKVAMAQGLVAAGSCLVSQNPAGWLRKAIEEDYSPPRTYGRHRERHVREKKDAKPCTRENGTKRAHTEPTGQHMPEEEREQAQTVPTEKMELEKTGRENETTWHKTLEQLQKDLAASDASDAETRLKGTTLLQVTDTAARIAVPSAIALAWLERRLYREIGNALKGVVGRDLDLQFVAAS